MLLKYNKHGGVGNESCGGWVGKQMTTYDRQVYHSVQELGL